MDTILDTITLEIKKHGEIYFSDNTFPFHLTFKLQNYLIADNSKTIEWNR
jgi:hypothetical protein